LRLRLCYVTKTLLPKGQKGTLGQLNKENPRREVSGVREGIISGLWWGKERTGKEDSKKRSDTSLSKREERTLKKEGWALR